MTKRRDELLPTERDELLPTDEQNEDEKVDEKAPRSIEDRVTRIEQELKRITHNIFNPEQ